MEEFLISTKRDIGKYRYKKAKKINDEATRKSEGSEETPHADARRAAKDAQAQAQSGQQGRSRNPAGGGTPAPWATTPTAPSR
ncbi:hypothetical protein [Achromobacter ruhlandii]|uniref:hypothetical protein n=1 Tax=Achromobacter ruhlandii TaxID=72557 RepID=UPI001EED6B1F|nr:hypothetical protein [Achromobacter ruhlandii]